MLSNSNEETHTKSDVVISGCTPLVLFHNVVALFQLNIRGRNNGILALISLDVKTCYPQGCSFHIERRSYVTRNHSLSKSLAMIDFENAFDHFDGDYM